MKITSGLYGGRPLNLPKGKDIRPTSDKVRQAIFNMLDSRGLVRDAYVLDAFCGTGALGLEALSRGAAFCIFIDKSKSSIDLCKENITLLNADNRARTLKADSTKLPFPLHSMKRSSLIFLDPPYNKGLVLPAIITLKENDWIEEDSVFLIETAKNESLLLEEHIQILIEKEYGDTRIILARNKK